jgi:hypothetical protein
MFPWCDLQKQITTQSIESGEMVKRMHFMCIYRGLMNIVLYLQRQQLQPLHSVGYFDVSRVLSVSNVHYQGLFLS